MDQPVAVSIEGIVEGLVARPGDTLVVRLNPSHDRRYRDGVQRGLEALLPPGVMVAVFLADGQLAVARPAQPDPRPLTPLPEAVAFDRITTGDDYGVMDTAP